MALKDLGEIFEIKAMTNLMIYLIHYIIKEIVKQTKLTYNRK